jgi:hypothetical protein
MFKGNVRHSCKAVIRATVALRYLHQVQIKLIDINGHWHLLV